MGDDTMSDGRLEDLHRPQALKVDFLKHKLERYCGQEVREAPPRSAGIPEVVSGNHGRFRHAQ